MKYKNGFFGRVKGCPEWLETTCTPIEHQGHQIVNRPSGPCIDILKDGVCVSMVGSVRYAKDHIDGVLSNNGGKASVETWLRRDNPHSKN